ncbi:thioredoxin-dependent thiol peroxidase [Tenuifilum sp.]|uniref:thioredoxin-dependent thiol peroxidase n=1 Tax=Tenuifilum sp. TaxID=2760880 RepID=UPI001B7075AB|nr:thioredoxin-dependent thiol peroxidase [Bacteroidales bacterium]HOK60056.1 thioredoxin-dependent thiol peroxidase [Tenuifilum sp.]HOK84722.1 thioredoxin-dependent thiol peroxidase [Tenuifilum sp.]HPP88973.1 thioredoxin-dependent thiol peroxidase [Tenuifilum sp.]HQG71400.1 thioredoxin-dependent thiol peroxidase [Tenuifilum sp.]
MATTILKPGDLAPEFIGKDQDGKTIKLSDFKGKKLILYFYPKDNTSGCTAEACSLRDGYDDLQSLGMEVVGVSPDSEKSHQNFIHKYNLPFRLIADVDHAIAEKYRAWGEKKMYGKAYFGILRTTYVINENGTITNVFNKVDTKEHVKQILSEINK